MSWLQKQEPGESLVHAKSINRPSRRPHDSPASEELLVVWHCVFHFTLLSRVALGVVLGLFLPGVCLCVCVCVCEREREREREREMKAGRKGAGWSHEIPKAADTRRRQGLEDRGASQSFGSGHQSSKPPASPGY